MKYVLIIFCILLASFIWIEPESINKRMGLIENINEELVPTKAVAEYCSQEPTDLGKIYCVNDYVINIYNYETLGTIRTIDYLLNSGGDCKAYSNFYKSVFNLMGFKSQYIYLPTHVFVTVYHEDFYCNLDLNVIECKEFSGGEK